MNFTSRVTDLPGGAFLASPIQCGGMPFSTVSPSGPSAFPHKGYACGEAVLMNAVLLERDRFVDAPVQERRFLFLISIHIFAAIKEDALIRGSTRSPFCVRRNL